MIYNHFQICVQRYIISVKWLRFFALFCQKTMKIRIIVLYWLQKWQVYEAFLLFIYSCSSSYLCLSFVQYMLTTSSVFVQCTTEQVLNKYWTSTGQVREKGGRRFGDGWTVGKRNVEVVLWGKICLLNCLFFFEKKFGYSKFFNEKEKCQS